MRTMILMFAAASAVAFAAPAAAVTYRFDVVETDPSRTGLPENNEVYNFSFDSNPVPATSTPQTFSIDGTIFLTADRLGPTLPSNFTFLTADVFGGVTTSLGQYSNEQLFTGDTSEPMFRLGVFVLDEATISITVDGAPASDVPEPAAWATMIAGFALVGASMRMHRSSLRMAA